MTSTKPQKEKPFNVAPRLAPRPTAASAARAARNASNRTVNAPANAQRQSPNRQQASPTMKRKSPCCQRNPSRAESKSDFQSKPESELSVNENPSNQSLGDQRDERDDSFPVAGDISSNQLDPEEHPPTSENDSEDRIESTTRNLTPATSRPQTPRSVSSRPTTPRANSRPSTPATRVGTPRSRPSTPQAPPARQPARALRPTTPTKLPVPAAAPQSARAVPPSSPSSPAPTISTPPARTQQPKEDGDIKTTYTEKQKQFKLLKKELDLKQQAVLEVFECLRVLRDRMSREGQASGEGEPQELVMFNVGDWTVEEVAQLVRDATSASSAGGAVALLEAVPDECALDELDGKILNIPEQFADLCLQAFSARQEMIDWIKQIISSDNPEANLNEETMELIAKYNTQGLQLCDALRDLKSRADDAVATVANVSKRICRDQVALITVGKSLVREVASLRQDLESRGAIINEMRYMRAEADTTKALEETRQQLEEEKAARLATKDKLATTEHQLRQSRIRISKMDRQLREAEASITSLTGTVKILEDQSRQREFQLEARARKLKESLKTGEVTSGQLAQHRDALQAEVLDLKEQIEKMTAAHKSAVSDLSNQLKELKATLEEQRQLTQKEVELKNAADAALVESQGTIDQLKAKITELENSLPNPELPTEREMDLWAELQATKETLRTTEEEVTACKREKVRFLETLTKIADSENKVGLQQKLAAELLNKEEILGKMQGQIRELTKNIKLNEEKVAQYEKYARELQAHNRNMVNSQESPNGISYHDLQQEIMNLRMGLLDAVHRNEELSEALAQKDQQLEQQDKTSRAQARVIKVREELINMLKNKETEQSRELCALQQDLEHRMKIVDEVNKQIAAKAEEIQELFATLENKQQQIHRLEKIVLALEEQQRRAQAQRTRHEEKIAALEHELAAGGNRRER